MKLRIGDKVRFLNEKGEGIITRFQNKDMAFVEMNDGFEIPYLIKQLVPVHTELILNPEVDNIHLEPDVKLSDAVYFVIQPDHEMPVLVNDYNLFLYNASSYNLAYSYSVKDDAYFQTLKHGEVGAYQKVLLKQVKKNFFKEYAYHKIECVLFKNMHYKAQLPIAEIIHVNEMVMKEQGLLKHEEFKLPIYAFLLKDEFDTTNKVEQSLSNEDMYRLRSIKEFVAPNKQSKPSRKRDVLEREVDLHIENLLDSHENLSNAQILNVQLDRFEQELDDAIANHLKKIIFIHGVGNGRLKQEIHNRLRGMEGIAYSDGSYKKYGFGATEVQIF